MTNKISNYYISIKRAMLFLAFVIISYGMYAESHALLVGIGNYDKDLTGWRAIHGNNDVYLLEKKLNEKGFSVEKLIDRQATKNAIKARLSNLITSSANGDLVYIHFSGHGQLFPDMNDDEQDDFDQSFVCYDACLSPNYKVSGKAYIGQNHFIDDELFPYLNELKRKVGEKGNVIVVFDACYSGGADRGDLIDDPEDDSDVEWDNTTRGTDDEFLINKSVNTYLHSIKKPGNYTSDGGNITIISACESDQKNYECKERLTGRKYGSLSYCIGKMLDKGLPFSDWGSFFLNKKYKSLHIFRPSQNPVVETHN